jgi:GNAT superfamily N-acetyltransferase
MSPLFETKNFRACEIAASEVPQIQGLYEANPDYFLAVYGQAPEANAAWEEFDELPPQHLGFTRRWFAGLYDRSDHLIGVAVVVSDLAAPSVWHIAFFMVATVLHGSGAASEIYAALETWARESGAKWMRLGVVQGYTRPERFWQKHSYQEVRVRDGLTYGNRTHTVRVLIKPMYAATVAEYLEAVPRDRPGSSLP